MLKFSYLISLISYLLSLISYFLSPCPVFAANLTGALIRPSRMTAGFTVTPTDPMLVVITPTDTFSQTETNVRVTFDANYTVTGPTVNTTTTGLPATLQGLPITPIPGITATSVVTGKSVDVTCTNLTPGTRYGFYLTSGITNPAATGAVFINTITTQLTAGGTIVDTARVATYNLTGSDQILITAQIPPTFDMVLSSNNLTFPDDLSTTPENSTSMTVTLATNARNGWATWIKSLNGGLLSPHAGLIATDNSNPTQCTAKTANQSFYQFTISATSIGGGAAATGTTITNLPKFNLCVAGTGGSLPANNWQEFAHNDGTTSGDVLTINALAGLAGMEAAATDYADTWDIIGAANF